jgi:hypothetical protein
MISLDQFLSTDPRDVGCAETMRMLAVYAETALADAEPERRLLGVAAHLRSCSPCHEDLRGLLAALGADAQ